MWSKYRPSGLLSGKGSVTYDGERWRYDADIDCKDTSFVHHVFQYPVTNCRGRILLRQQQLTFKLNGLAGSTPVLMEGSFEHPGPRATGWSRVETKQQMPIDDALVNALKPSAREFLRDLSLRGKVDIVANFKKRVRGLDQWIVT